MPARKKAKVADTRLPHANDIEFLAAFRGYVEVTELKSQSDEQLSMRREWRTKCRTRAARAQVRWLFGTGSQRRCGECGSASAGMCGGSRRQRRGHGRRHAERRAPPQPFQLFIHDQAVPDLIMWALRQFFIAIERKKTLRYDGRGVWGPGVEVRGSRARFGGWQ